MISAAWICLLLPLASALAITLGGTHISRRAAGYISTLTTMGSFAAAAVAFFEMVSRAGGDRVSVTTSWTWLEAGPYHFGLSLLVDQLSVLMMLIVAGVSSLIIAYSVGYMDGEDEERRYFAYMSLFVFSMLLLVQGGNLLLLLAGWGMVGLSSYLLIGFHQDRPSAVAAAKKAFIMNAFGDATMVLALFLLVDKTGGLDYASVGPEHAMLHDSGRAEYTSATDAEALAATRTLAHTEGILPALESAHAVAEAIKLAPKMAKTDVLMVNLSGRGDKDMGILAREMDLQGAVAPKESAR